MAEYPGFVVEDLLRQLQLASIANFTPSLRTRLASYSRAERDINLIRSVVYGICWHCVATTENVWVTTVAIVGNCNW